MLSKNCTIYGHMNLYQYFKNWTRNQTDEISGIGSIGPTIIFLFS